MIGAGAVGIEFASVFARFGSDGDGDRAAAARAAARGRGDLGRGAASCSAKYMTIHTGAKTEGALKTAQRRRGGVPHRRRRGRRASPPRSCWWRWAADRSRTASASNRRRCSSTAATSRSTTKMETDEPGVFAIGDVVTVDGQPHPQLAHVASAEGIGVAERLAGKHVEPVNYDQRALGHLLHARRSRASASPRRRRRSAATTSRSAASPSATWPSRASSARTSGCVKVVSEAQVRRGAGRPHGRPARHRPHLGGLRGAAAREPRPRRSRAPSTRTRRCPRRSCRPPRRSTATPSTPRRDRRGAARASGGRAHQGAAARAVPLHEAEPHGRGEAHQPLPPGQGGGRPLPQPRPGGLLGGQRLRARAGRHLHAAHPQPGRHLRARRPAARRVRPVHGQAPPGPPAAATSTPTSAGSPRRAACSP